MLKKELMGASAVPTANPALAARNGEGQISVAAFRTLSRSASDRPRSRIGPCRALGGRPALWIEEQLHRHIGRTPLALCDARQDPEQGNANRGRRTDPAVKEAARRALLIPDLGSRQGTFDHKRFSMETDIDVYFCDPQSPWQRGSNENTNRLLRQYFPKGLDLAAHSQAELNKVARQSTSGQEKRWTSVAAERFSQCVCGDRLRPPPKPAVSRCSTPQPIRSPRRRVAGETEAHRGQASWRS